MPLTLWFVWLVDFLLFQGSQLLLLHEEFVNDFFRNGKFNCYMYHCVKSVQIRSFFWSVFPCIRAYYTELRVKISVFGHFSCSESLPIRITNYIKNHMLKRIKMTMRFINILERVFEKSHLGQFSYILVYVTLHIYHTHNSVYTILTSTQGPAGISGKSGRCIRVIYSCVDNSSLSF